MIGASAAPRRRPAGTTGEWHFSALCARRRYAHSVIGFALVALAALAVTAAASFWFKYQYNRTPSFKLTPKERQKVVLSVVMNTSIWLQIGTAILALFVLALLAVIGFTDVL